MICTNCGQEMRSSVDDYTHSLCSMCQSQFSNSFSKIANALALFYERDPDPGEIGRLKAEIEQMKKDRADDIDGILAIRRECEASENETFPTFVKRLYTENKKLKQEVVDHMEWARKVATDPEFAPAMEIIKKLTAAENKLKQIKNITNE